MRGFSDRAVILFPKIENYEYKDFEYKSKLKTSVINLINFMNNINIKCYSITTNEVATLIEFGNTNWINCVTEEDAFFLSRNYSSYNKVRSGDSPSDIILEKARKKYPIRRGLIKEERLEIVTKREGFIANEIISEFKVVIDIQKPSDKAYKVNSEINDERIIIELDDVTFTITTKISGNPIDSLLLLQDKKVSLPLYLWE